MLYLQVTLLCVCCVQWIYTGVTASPTPWTASSTKGYEDVLTTSVPDLRTGDTEEAESTSDYPGGDPTTSNFEFTADSNGGREEGVGGEGGRGGVGADEEESAALPPSALRNRSHNNGHGQTSVVAPAPVSEPETESDGQSQSQIQQEKAAEPDTGTESQPPLSSAADPAVALPVPSSAAAAAATDGNSQDPNWGDYMYSVVDSEEDGPKITLFSVSGLLNNKPQFSTRDGGSHPSTATDSSSTANSTQVFYSSTTPYPPFSSQYFEDTKDSTSTKTETPLRKEEEYLSSPSTERPSSENDITEGNLDSKRFYRPFQSISSNYIEDNQPSESKNGLLNELRSAIRAALQEAPEDETSESDDGNLQITSFLADINAATPVNTSMTDANTTTIENLTNSISSYLITEEKKQGDSGVASDSSQSETANSQSEPVSPTAGRNVTPSMKPIIVTDLVYYNPEAVPNYSEEPAPVYNPPFFYETDSSGEQATPSEGDTSNGTRSEVAYESVESQSNGESGQLRVQPQPPLDTSTSQGTTPHTTAVREVTPTTPTGRVEEYTVTPSQQQDYAPSASDQIEIANLKNYQIFGQKIVKEDNKRNREVEVQKQELEAKPVYTTVVEIQKSVPLEVKDISQNYDVYIEPNVGKTPSNEVQEVIGNNVEQQSHQQTTADYQPTLQPTSQFVSNEYQQLPQVQPTPNDYLSLEQYQAQRYQDGAQQGGQQNILFIQALPALAPTEIIGNTLHPLREQQEQMASENQPYASHYIEQMSAVPVPLNIEHSPFVQPQPQHPESSILVNLEQQPVQTHFPAKHHSLHYNLINEPHYGRPAVPTYSPILYHRLYGDKTNSHKGYGGVAGGGGIGPALSPHSIPVPLTKILPPAPVPIGSHYNTAPAPQPALQPASPYPSSNSGAPYNYPPAASYNYSPFSNTIRESAPENRVPYGHNFPYGKSKINVEKIRQQILRYDPHSRNPPFRPSMQLYDSVYPPQMFYVERVITKRGSNGRGTRGVFAKKLCVEYGGFKPPLIPSVEIKDDPAPSFAKKSDQEN